MRTVNISELRSNLLNYLEQANAGEQISVTSNGRLLATICAPLDQRELARAALRTLAAGAKVHDVISPVSSAWDAMA